MENIKFEVNANGCKILMEIDIPVKAPKIITESEARTNHKGFVCDIIGAYADTLINTLLRRMNACKKVMLAHIEDSYLLEGTNTIMWKRKDGSFGRFNVSSMKVMEEAVDDLQHRRWWKFASTPEKVGQTIKAIMNDNEIIRNDMNRFKFSELVSCLTEMHLHQ